MEAQQFGLRLNDEFAVYGTIEHMFGRVKQSRTGGHTMGELLDLYQKDFYDRRLASGQMTQRSYDIHDKAHMKMLREKFGSTYLQDITRQDLYECVKDKAKTPYSHCRKVMKNLFIRAKAIGWYEGESPADLIQTYAQTGGDVSKKRARMSWENFLILYAYAKKLPTPEQWFLDALTIQLYTGVGRNELCHMRYDSIKDNIWYYTREKTKTCPHANVACVLPSQVMKIVEKNRNRQHEFVITRKSNNQGWLQIPSETYTKKFRKLVIASGVGRRIPADQTRPSTHEIRALAASVNMAIREDDGREAQRLLAHKNAATTAIYLKGHANKNFLRAECITENIEDIKLTEEQCNDGNKKFTEH